MDKRNWLVVGLSAAVAACGGGGNGDGLGSGSYGPDTLVVEVDFSNGANFGSVTNSADEAWARVTFDVGSDGTTVGDYRLFYRRTMSATPVVRLERFSGSVFSTESSDITATLSGNRLTWVIPFANHVRRAELDLITLSTPLQLETQKESTTPNALDIDFIPNSASFEAPGNDGVVNDRDLEPGNIADALRVRVRVF